MKIYNSLTKKNKNFLPLNTPYVSMHADGVTSGDDAYLGHAIAAVRFSAIRQYLSYKGYKVECIDNSMGTNIKMEVSLPEKTIDIHCGTLNVDGIKMSQSSNNLITKEDGLEKYGKELLTWVVLRHHYRSSIDLNDQLFRDNLNILRDFYIHISPSALEAAIAQPDLSDPQVKKLFGEFETEMDNDFNTPGALVSLSRYLEEAVSLKNQKKQASSKRLEEAVVYLGRLLGLFQSQNLADLTSAMLAFQQQALRTPEVIAIDDIDLLIKDREEARGNKAFAKADHICNLLKLHGIAIVDGADKNKWKFTAS
jgi:cysteinyl-tRNA synthetase